MLPHPSQPVTDGGVPLEFVTPHLTSTTHPNHRAFYSGGGCFCPKPTHETDTWSSWGFIIGACLALRADFSSSQCIFVPSCSPERLRFGLRISDTPGSQRYLHQHFWCRGARCCTQTETDPRGQKPSRFSAVHRPYAHKRKQTQGAENSHRAFQTHAQTEVGTLGTIETR